MTPQTPPNREPRSDLDNSIIAQLLECGLVARYRGDLDGGNDARRKVRDELLEKGWILPPYTYEGDV